MLSDLTNFKSFFNNLSNLENFQNENTQVKSSAFQQTPASPKEEKNVKNLFTPVLMPYDFQSNDPIGDLFNNVKLDGTVPSSNKKASRSKVDSEVSLITECPPGYKPSGDVNVNSTYLKCKPDGTPIKPEANNTFLAQQNSCVYKSKYNNPSSASANLMPKPSNDGTESSTDSDQMVSRSANASRVLSEAMSKSILKSARSKKSEKSEKNKKQVGGKSLNKVRELSAIKSVSISGSDLDVSDSGLSSSSDDMSSSASSSSNAKSSSSEALSSTSSKKVKKSDVKSYKHAVEKASKQKYGNTTTDN